MRKPTIFLMAFLGIGMISVSVQAKGSMRFQDKEMSRGRQEYVRSMMNDLNLTPAQQERLLQQRKQQHEQSKRLRDQLREKQDALNVELRKAQTDPAQLNRLTEEIKRLQGTLLENRVDGVMELKQTLSPEQYQAFQKKVQEHRKQRRRHE